MVFFGHVGVTLGVGWLGQAVAGRAGGNKGAIGLARQVQRGLDLRWLAVGSILPDMIDKPLGQFLFFDFFRSGRVMAHTLLFALLLLATGLVAGGRARVPLYLLGIGSLGHLALDQMWALPQTLYWPLLGWRFAELDIGPLLPHLQRSLSHPGVFVPELVGMLVSLGLLARILATGRVRAFLATGRA